MKNFESEAIKSRVTENLRRNANTADIIEEGTISLLSNAWAESLAEAARYLEYNTLEKRWATAQNMSSLTTMGELIGYKRSRPKSATGFILVSHDDIEGNPRLPNYGTLFFNKDALSDYDNSDEQKISNASEEMRSALVPWRGNAYTIRKGTRFISNTGIEFIATEDITSKTFEGEDYSLITSDTEKYNSFIEEGGWDGIKYVRVPVIQGIQKETYVGITSGMNFETFKINIANAEDASNSISKKFFYLTVEGESENGQTEKNNYAEIRNIHAAGPYDMVFQADVSPDGNSLIIKLGNGISGKVPISGSKLTLHYIETLGSNGNISVINSVQTIIADEIADSRMDDSNPKNIIFSCTNITSLNGGKDIEDEVYYKHYAPLSYLKSYTTTTIDAYKNFILENSPVQFNKVKCAAGTSIETIQMDTGDIDDPGVEEELDSVVKTIGTSINITGILSDGNSLKEDGFDEKEDFINPLVKLSGDLKGPNDSFKYIEPNKIRIAPSIIIGSYDKDISEESIKQTVSNSILNKYSIFNTDFEKDFYASDLTYLSSRYSFADSVNVIVEALANVDYDKNTVGTMSDNKSYTAIPFKFDKVYLNNKYAAGFKNKSSNPYVIKVAIDFTNNKTFNRTMFLYDGRQNDNTELNKAKTLTVNENTTTKINDSDESKGLYFFDETLDTFNDRVVRIAQFMDNDKITDSKYMAMAKSFASSPKEVRPYIVDSNGKNIQYLVDNVPSNLQANVTKGNETYCYKKNEYWLDGFDVSFTEAYNDENSDTSISGYVSIPLEAILSSSGTQISPATDNSSLTIKDLDGLVDIKVYAVPVSTEITTNSWNDIIYIDDADIKVKKELKIY